jgi:hypothetical protein
MHPDHRQTWASSWGRLIRPGGTLVTLIFPVLPDADPSVGPPFPISPELYTSLLPPAGFEIVSMEKVPAERSVGGRAGKEWLGVWRRRAAQL